jgi:uncharacterized protein (DUF362 family)
MNPRKINRRRFLATTLQSAAGLGVLARCDKRTVAGTDIPGPSAPVGMAEKISKLPDGTIAVNVSWQKHDLTDITGAKTETAITYNLYRDDALIASGLSGTSFTDTNNIRMNDTLVYTLKAVDTVKNNESPFSAPLTVAILPFVDVFTVTRPDFMTGTSLIGSNIQPDIVKSMLHAAVMKMTGVTTVALAWESLFPALSASTLIGIKINTLGMGNISTKPQVVDAIVDGLTQMLGGTFPAYNIVVFDDRGKDSHMKPAGYILRNDPGMYRITSIAYNTTLDPAAPMTVRQADADLWGTTFSVENVSQRLSKLVESLDYIINVPILKDHTQAGITFSMKNLYGLIDGPSRLHDNMCNPFIPALYSTTAAGVKLKDKIRLIVGDALIGCSTGGPAGYPNIKPCTIIVGTDPVAIDKWALDTINSLRPAKLQIPLTQVANVAQDARHIFAASQPPHSLGSTNYAVTVVTV